MQSSTPELNWDKLRKQGRLLEQEIDSRLSSFAKSISETYDEKELENLLHKLQNVVNNMAISIEQSSTPSQLHMLQRHRDILFDFEREFKKVKSNFRSIRDHNELLSGVGEEFNAYKSGNRSSSMQDYLLNERGKINNSHHQVDIVLE
ncbi:hypothetical protein HK099_005390 [Clydaea vesicula]|uniref:Golgi SNAP receptor complex member 1 n=1 Tax=Clydaea vesicula TaxID=447962 RepID=A0AAD5TZB3_9FUNG|nr:hypothetical protein HK099_005390 [Clydaea vesicula]